MIGSLAFSSIYKILNFVAPCVQQIVFMFWITPQLLFNLRVKEAIHIQREKSSWNQQYAMLI